MKLGLILLLLCVSGAVTASIEAYPFPDEQLRQRYQDLIAELRCPQCLNTNLAGSDAMVASDLRREVHRMLLAGKSDPEILDFMHERYGDFILYRPRVTAATYLLWFGPFLLLGVGGYVLYRFVATRRPLVSPALDAADAERLDKLVKR